MAIQRVFKTALAYLNDCQDCKLQLTVHIQLDKILSSKSLVVISLSTEVCGKEMALSMTSSTTSSSVMLQMYGYSSGGVGVGGAPGAPTASSDTSVVHANSPSPPLSSSRYPRPPPPRPPWRRPGSTPQARWRGAQPRKAATLVEVAADDERQELLVPLCGGPPDILGEG
ncbi:hypothetical protein GUJ93_ZPchr0014g46688 [Zizania palustris]|uniref:Uncharacterized protein n=1 Tax=Zizania palustris TaxID=103762 RepID=A0A8J5TET5_ZIZPA|nr:hypothetical protein GUJ93_ZPchr0014g46688 [Zizania palustris]